ncbi:Cdc6/Cdc18 family protein [Caldiplasma sukawensis]
MIRYREGLDFSYVPEKLKFRETQINIVENLLIQPALSGINNNISFYGISGTGKTVTARYLMKNFHQNMFFLYENGASFSTIKSLLIHLLEKNGMVIYKSSQFPEIFNGLIRLEEKTRKPQTIIIDEATNLMKFDRDGIYNLLRSHEMYGAHISVICITMEDPALFLTQRERNSLGLFSILNFPKYTTDEIFEILKDRASLCLSERSYDDDTLHYISEVSSTFGSARVAIELLQKSAFIARGRGSDFIETEDVRTAQSTISPYITESKLAGLSFEELVILLTVARSLENSSYVEFMKVVSSYRSFAELYGIKEVSERTVYRIVSKLENLGILESRVMGKGYRKGVEKVLAINDVPTSVLAEKIESILSKY